MLAQTSRKALTWKLFLVALLLNACLLWLVWPTQDTGKSSPQPQRRADQVEIKIKAVLHTSFAVHKKVLLVSQSGELVGEVMLVNFEDESATVWLSQELYRRHHRVLVHHPWLLLPHSEGLSYHRHHSKETYEITY